MSKMTVIDWDLLESEYIRGKSLNKKDDWTLDRSYPTCKNLCEKYDIALITVETSCSKYNWLKKRKEHIKRLELLNSLRTKDGIVSYITKENMSLLEFYSRSLGICRLRFLREVNDGNARQADIWSKIIARYSEDMNKLLSTIQVTDSSSRTKLPSKETIINVIKDEIRLKIDSAMKDKNVTIDLNNDEEDAILIE